MRFLLGMCALFTLPLWANTQVTTQIHDIDHGDNITDEALVFLASGQVVKINVNDTVLLNRLSSSLQKREDVKLEIGDNREILDIVPLPTKLSPPPVMSMGKSISAIDPLAGYNPSVASPELAKQMFRESRHASKEETQCFNRAMVWSYEWRVKHNFYAKKIWVFFTRKFVRRYNFDWWFHVAPMINMAVDGQVKERVMDVKYSSQPLAPQAWAKIFLRGSGAKCPYVKKYSDHANYPEAGWCFFQKSPMYYYQPIDLEYLEKFGNEKRAFVEADVRGAYAEAFEIYP